MSEQENTSQMLVDISGDLLYSAGSASELQSRLDMLVVAWNMSLLSRADRALKMKRFIRKQKSAAPSKEALKSLEGEIKKIVKRKLDLYPGLDTELVRAEALIQSQDSFEIKVYFKDKEEEAKQEQAKYTITRLNEEMATRELSDLSKLGIK